MATLKSIRTRIVSVKNTQKITKAMKMVAAAKLRRAQAAVVAARPYADQLQNIISMMAGQLDGEAHPIFQKKENPKRVSFLIFTSNRGLCGGFNSNLLRSVDTYLKGIQKNYEVIDLRVVGKKGRDYYKARKREMKDVYLDYADQFSFEEAVEKACEMMEGLAKGTYDEYFIVYNQFKSAISQEITIKKIIPLEACESSSPSDERTRGIDFLMEPSRKEILDYVIPKYVATQLYRAHLESVASELGARMTAMESATSNASDMISRLTLQFNRLRQAAITTELMDIVNGAEAIK